MSKDRQPSRGTGSERDTEQPTTWFMDLLVSTDQRSLPQGGPPPDIPPRMMVGDRRRVVLRLQAQAVAQLLAARR